MSTSTIGFVTKWALRGLVVGLFVGVVAAALLESGAMLLQWFAPAMHLPDGLADHLVQRFFSHASLSAEGMSVPFAAMTVVLSGALLGASTAALIGALRIDTEDDSLAAWRWACSGLRKSWPAYAALLLLAGALSLWLRWWESLGLWLVLTAPVLGGIYAPTTAASADASCWWKPQWPGLVPIVLYVSALIAAKVLVAATNALALPLALAAPLSYLAGSVLSLIATATLALRWQFANWTPKSLLPLLRKNLGAWMLLDFWLMPAFAPVLALGLMSKGFQIFIEPQILANSAQSDVGALGHVVMAAMHAAEHAFVVLVAGLLIALHLACSRLIHHRMNPMAVSTALRKFSP